MIKATIKDRQKVVLLLEQAFKDNLSVNFIVKQDKKRFHRIKALMEYSFDTCMEFGEVLLSEGNDATVLLLYPHLKKSSIYSFWLDIKLILKTIGIERIGKAIKREGLIKKLQPKEPMVYLWFIGVNPLVQHCGIGSKLLQETLELAELKYLPVYLETSTVNNIAWYKCFGFKIYDQLDLGYKLYFLYRKMDKD